MAHSAVDNALAMIEVGKQDVVIVTGGDSGMNEFFVQGDIKSFADLRGRTLVVDAPDTAYALQAKKILAQHGLKEGTDYTVKPVGAGVYPLQGDGGEQGQRGGHPQSAVHRAGRAARHEEPRPHHRPARPLPGRAAPSSMRAWAREHAAALERYIAAYIEALRWVRDPANRAENIAMLMEKLKISGKEAERTYELLIDPAFGFTPDATFDLRGLQECAGVARRDRRRHARRRPSAISTSAITSGRFHGWAADEDVGRPSWAKGGGSLSLGKRP